MGSKKKAQTNPLPNPSLEGLIVNKHILFFSSGRELNTDIKNFGQYNWDLVKHIAKQSGDYITIGSTTPFPLLQHLSDINNLYAFTNFLVQFWFEAVSARKKLHTAIHVDVDMDKIGLHYRKPEEEKLVNGLGQVVGNAADWVPEMPYFEKVWNFALDQAIGGMVGYPGYEHPRNDLSFRVRVAELSENYMIGTKLQIQRYKKYALDALQNLTNIADQLKAKPELIFHDENYNLRGIELNSQQARIIAENIMHFNINY